MSVKKNKISIEDKQDRLGELLSKWALLAYTDINHPLAECTENFHPRGFKQRVLMAGLIVIPDLLAEELKNPSFRNKSARNTELFNESEYNQWEQLKRAATTNDPSLDKLRQLIIKPIMQSLMIDAFLDSAHPLHYAHKLITELVYSKNATEAAKLEAMKEGSADRFHRLDIGITAAMTRFTAKIGISLVNSKNAEHSPEDDGLSRFMAKVFEKNIKTSAKEMMRVIESYASKYVAYKANQLLVAPKMYDEVGKIEVTTDGDNQLIRYEISSILSGELKHSVSAASSSFTTRVSRERTKYKYKNKMNP